MEQELKNKRTPSKLSEQERIVEIRNAAIKEAAKLKKEGKSVNTNAAEVVCREEDIFRSKSKKTDNHDIF